MTAFLAQPGHRPLSKLAMAVFYLAILLGLFAMLSGFGSRLGWWNFGTGFTLLKWTAYAAIAVVVLSLIAAFITRPSGPRRGLALAVLALLVAGAVAVIPWNWRRTARSVPPIHDITTDTENPPAFVAMLPLRADAPNPVEYGGPEIAAQQREAYPDIQPLVLDVSPEQAFESAVRTAREMGWEVVAEEPAEGRIEATDETFWFGFKDDVVIRVTPQGTGTRVDVRSLSRVGGSDVGTNAERIREYLDELRDTD